MQIRTRETCKNCGGTGCVSWVDHAGMTHEDIHEDCEGTGWIEEWRDMETTTLREYLMLLKHDQELIAIHELLRTITERTNHQAEHIERLEKIICDMVTGSETSVGDHGPGHTHWVYPLNKAQGLVEEIGRQKHDT